MKRNALEILGLGFMILNANGAWAGYIDESGEASGEIGAGALSAVAAPLVLVPAVVAGGAATTASGVAHLLEATGKELSDLTETVLEQTAYEREAWRAAHPRDCNCVATVTVNGREKTIPLVTRKEYVQMNERIEKE